MFIEKKCCRLCSGHRTSTILDLGSTALANSFRADAYKIDEKYPLQVFLCEDCGSVQLRHTVDPNILFSNYSYQSSHNKALANHFVSYASDSIQYRAFYGESQSKLMVDIGGNCGVLCRPFKVWGFNAINVEPASNLAKISEESGIETVNDFFTPEVARQIVEKHGKAAFVTCNNCFAHIDNLHEIIDGIDLLLEDTGEFIFENAYWLNSVEGMYIDQIYHEHLFYHTLKPLKQFLNSRGYNIIRFTLNENQGGSFRIHCAKQTTGISECPEVEHQINKEKSAGIYEVEFYKRWFNKIKKIGHNLSYILSCYHELGVPVYAYGAPAKATTLLHVLQCFHYIQACVDDSPLKIGTYLPDISIPVISSDEWKSKPPGITVILAWNFADFIIQKQKESLDKGGSFLVPLPDIRIIN